MSEIYSYISIKSLTPAMFKPRKPKNTTIARTIKTTQAINIQSVIFVHLPAESDASSEAL